MSNEWKEVKKRKERYIKRIERSEKEKRKKSKRNRKKLAMERRRQTNAEVHRASLACQAGPTICSKIWPSICCSAYFSVRFLFLIFSPKIYVLNLITFTNYSVVFRFVISYYCICTSGFLVWTRTRFESSFLYQFIECTVYPRWWTHRH
jgi:hypothetical protein